MCVPKSVPWGQFPVFQETHFLPRVSDVTVPMIQHEAAANERYAEAGLGWAKPIDRSGVSWPFFIRCRVVEVKGTRTSDVQCDNSVVLFEFIFSFSALQWLQKRWITGESKSY